MARSRLVEKPADAEGGRIVDRNPPLAVVAGEQGVRPQARPPDRPERVVLGHALLNSPIDEPVLELVETDLQVGRRRLAGPPLQVVAPVAVQPLEVDRIDGVLLALDPVAGDLGEYDLDHP